MLRLRVAAGGVLLGCLALFGCGDTVYNYYYSNGTAAQTSSGPLDPGDLMQFGSPLVEIPIANAPADNVYTVVERQGSWDFGLRRVDGEKIMDPATGKEIVTKTWGYEINNVFLGIYGTTVEAVKGTQLTFKYVNDIREEVNGVKGTGKPLTKHLLEVDPTVDGSSMGEPQVRLSPHLHGGDVAWTSDGHPLSWVTNDSSVQAKWAAPADPAKGFPGRPATNAQPDFIYPNSQSAATLWFHDHSMGITRLNAYAGVAAFYLIKDPAVEGVGALANLPKGRYDNPVAPSLKSDEFDLPIVIQDKDFNDDGSLVFKTFKNRGAYSYELLTDQNGTPVASLRPEMFGGVVVVNGKAWPYKEVKTQAYRLRLLNGSDSRFFNIYLQDYDTGEIITPAVAAAAGPGLTWPVVQIAAEQGYGDHAVDVMTGPGEDGLLLSNGARSDIIIDFAHPVFKGRNIIVRNDAPAPFSGFFGPEFDDPETLDQKTTGKVMLFKVANTVGVPSPLLAAAGPATSLRTALVPYGAFPNLTPTRAAGPRYLDFQEQVDSSHAVVDPATGGMGPRMELLLNNMHFSDPITEKPKLNDVEEWVFINATPDVHPMHIHLVKFEVVEKGYIDTETYPDAYTKADGVALPIIRRPEAFIENAEPGEAEDSAGPNSVYRLSAVEKMFWRDTVPVPPAGVALEAFTKVENPGYVKVRAVFSRPGGYVWHCHILSHEENEMMRPFLVVP